MANTILAKMAVQIAANTAEFNKALQKSQNDLKSFTGGITKLAGTLGVAFGVQQVASFAFEVSKLAGEAEGVKAAFDKLPESQRLMTQLKDATAGTVSELELMKRSVQAANFGIALESLPELLKFAAIRAQQTGQSVDYLVDSIITGIGRKSPLILDNLGISAVRLKEKFNGASLEAQNIGDVAKAVGAIASEELGKMGDFSDNASSKVQKLSASWENLKVAIGSALNESGIFAGALDSLTKLIGNVSGENKLKNAVESLAIAFNNGKSDATGFASTIAELEKEFGKGNLAIASNDLDNITEGMSSAATVSVKLKERLKELGITITGLNEVALGPNQFTPFFIPEVKPEQITNIESLRAKLVELNKEYESLADTDKKGLALKGQDIIKTQELIAELEKYRKKTTEVEQAKRRDIDATFAQIAGIKAYQEEINKSLQSGQGEGLGESAKKFNEEFVSSIAVTKEKINAAAAGLSESIKGFATTAKEEVQGLIDVGPLIANAISGIADALGSALASGNFKNFGKALVETVASFAQQLGSLMIASGIGQIALKSGNPAVMIAAGAALVAAGAAIKATLKKQSSFPSAGTSGGGGSSYQSGKVDVGGNEDRIIFDANFRISGNDLVAVFDSTNKNNSRIRG